MAEWRRKLLRGLIRACSRESERRRHGVARRRAHPIPLRDMNANGANGANAGGAISAPVTVATIKRSGSWEHVEFS